MRTRSAVVALLLATTACASAPARTPSTAAAADVPKLVDLQDDSGRKLVEAFHRAGLSCTWHVVPRPLTDYGVCQPTGGTPLFFFYPALFESSFSRILFSVQYPHPAKACGVDNPSPLPVLELGLQSFGFAVCNQSALRIKYPLILPREGMTADDIADVGLRWARLLPGALKAFKVDELVSGPAETLDEYKP